jgi:hypothetical protein
MKFTLKGATCKLGGSPRDALQFTSRMADMVLISLFVFVSAQGFFRGGCAPETHQISKRVLYVPERRVNLRESRIVRARRPRLTRAHLGHKLMQFMVRFHLLFVQGLQSLFLLALF